VPLAGYEQVPRYNEALARLLGEDLEFVPPGFILEDDRPEWRFLKRERTWFSQNVNVGAVAAQFGFYQIFNNSQDRIVIVDGLYATVGTVGVEVAVGLTTTIRGATGGAFPVALDTRWNSPVLPTAALVARDPVVISTGNAVGFGTDTQIGKFGTVLGVSKLPTPPIVLAPGTGCNIVHTVVNSAMEAQASGYSRPARPEELVI
jgi:hypothetical protein